MYTRLFAALLIVAATSTTMAYTTFAYFSDTETVQNTEFLSGTIDLSVAAPGEFTAALGQGNFAPGDASSGELALSNTGTIRDGDAEGHSVVMDWKMTVAQTDADGVSTDLADYIQVTTLYYGEDYLSAVDGGVAIADANGNGWIDLSDVAAAGPYTGVADPGAAGKTMSIAVLFRGEAGNALQGDTASIDFTFFLRQAQEPALV